MARKKTSVYLSDEDRERLARIAERKGESQAWVLREALAAYDASLPDRNFAIFDMWKTTPPGTYPHFDDPQEFNDWVERTVGEAMAADLDQQLEDAKHWMNQPK